MISDVFFFHAKFVYLKQTLLYSNFNIRVGLPYHLQWNINRNFDCHVSAKTSFFLQFENRY